MSGDQQRSHLGGSEVGTTQLRKIGGRLTHIRGARTQVAFSADLGIHKNTLGSYERGDREIGALALLKVAALGWSPTWLLTGEGPERLSQLQAAEGAEEAASQELSEEALTIALEIADDIARTRGWQYVSRPKLARLVKLLYEGLTQGLPEAEVYVLGGGRLNRDEPSETSGEGPDVGEHEVGRQGQGGRR